MSEMYKSLRFRRVNTAKELATPVDPEDAFRLVDFREGASNITNEFQAADTEEAQVRADGDAALQTRLSAEVAQLEAAYRAAVAQEAAARQADVQALVSGFTVKDPVYCVINAPMTLSGLVVNSPSFSGTLPATDAAGNPTRVLVIAQGGNPGVADPANGFYEVANGAWVRAADANEDTEVINSILAPVERGADGFANTIWYLAAPQIFTDVAIGTTPLRFARWLGTDIVRGDETTVHREGNVLNVMLNPDQLQPGANGVELLPTFIAQLRDLTQATGLLNTDQIRGLLAYVTGITLNSFAAPTTSVPYNDQRITNLADPTSPQDAVNQRTLQGSINALNNSINALNTTLSQAIQAQEDKDGYFPLSGGSVVGNDLVVPVTHNKNSFKIMKEVIDTTNGETVDTDFVRIMNDGNVCHVVFRGHTTITPGQFALMIHRVAA